MIAAWLNECTQHFHMCPTCGQRMVNIAAYLTLQWSHENGHWKNPFLGPVLVNFRLLFEKGRVQPSTKMCLYPSCKVLEDLKPQFFATKNWPIRPSLTTVGERVCGGRSGGHAWAGRRASGFTVPKFGRIMKFSWTPLKNSSFFSFWLGHQHTKI